MFPLLDTVSSPLRFLVYIINGSEKCERPSYAELIFQPHECFSCDNLMSKLYRSFPFLMDENHYITCLDEYGNGLYISYDEDLDRMMSNKFEGERTLYVLYNAEAYIRTKNSFPSQYYCNRCCFVLKHFRYKCMTCPEYELCSNCAGNGYHGFHDLEYLDIVPSENAPPLQLRKINTWDKNRIGEGGFGVVYSAHDQRTNYRIAVKFFKDPYGADVADSFLKELDVIKHAGEHINVVRTLGYCVDTNPTNFGLAMECITMRIGGKEISGLIMYLMHLRKLFKSGRKHEIDRRELDSFALQIARGMAHLESKNIVHRDLAARNILIDNNRNLKVSDFGLSRVGDYYQGDFNVFAGRWAAPEVIKHDRYTNKSDVWAFGVVLWEIATLGGLPYSWVKDVRDHVIKGKRLFKPASMSDRLYDVMSRCWTGRPENRPDFSDLVDKFLDFKWLPNCFFDFDGFRDYVLPDACKIYERRAR